MKILAIVLFMMVIAFSFNLINEFMLFPMSNEINKASISPVGSDLGLGVSGASNCGEKDIACKVQNQDLDAFTPDVGGSTGGLISATFDTAKYFVVGIKRFVGIFLKSTLFIGSTLDDMAMRMSVITEHNEQSYYMKQSNPSSHLSRFLCETEHNGVYSDELGLCFYKKEGGVGKQGVYYVVKPYLLFFVHFFQILAIIQLVTGQGFKNQT